MKQDRISTISNRIQMKVAALLLGFAALFAVCLMAPASAFAEGSMNLTDNDGYRPYTERYGATTSEVERKQMMWTDVSDGEHVMLGTSVWGVKLDRPDYADSEIHVKVHGDGTETGTVTRELRISVDNTGAGYVAELAADGSLVGTTALADGVGCIANRTQEKNGPNAVAGASADGYTPVDIEVDSDLKGMWEIEFYSKGLTNQNPVMTKISDGEDFEKDQKGGTLAAWDITVTGSDKVAKNGRVYTHKLFLNMGGNKYNNDVLKSKVWVYTDDGFSYNVDFNGMDPYGFIFFANNRGLLYKNADGSTQSLYHSVVTRDNQMNGLVEHNILLNLVPTDTVDKTYKIFFNEPDSDKFPAATAALFAGGTVNDLSFVGSKGNGETYVGDGGKFTFTAQDPKASSYKIKLTFTDGSVVALGNNLVNGANEVTWDGKDSHGHLATPENTITGVSMEFNGGETHFPMMDVENNRNGIKIENATPGWNFGGTDPTLVYYDNVNDDPDKFSTGWNPSISGWTAIGGGGDTHVSGISSQNGAMSYGSSNQFDWPHTGNQAALDLWTYVSAVTTVNNPDITILDEPTSISLKGTKIVEGRPITETYRFVVREGAKQVATGASDGLGNITFTPITYTTKGTHTYTISEVAGADTHIDYDATAHTVTVDVTADASGNLNAAATYGVTDGDDDTNGVVFTNRYTPGSTTYTIRAEKDLVNSGAGGHQLAADEFTFNLLNADNEVVETVTNDADGAITFSSLSFTAKGTYTYYIQEVVDAAHSTSNWVCDTSKHPVTITVKEVDENLVATADLPAGGLVIKNLFREQSDSLIFWGNKNLTGRSLQAGEFDFGLYLNAIDAGAGTAPAVDPDEVIYTASNDQTGAVIFNWINYGEIFNPDRAEGDTYTYVIKENATDPEPHITYDTADKTVYVHVYEKNEGGTLSVVAESSVPDEQGDVLFNNAYAPDPVGIVLSVSKTYEGATLAGGDFTFQVKDSDGTVVGTATNDTAGAVIFEPISVTAPGQYKYVVTEVAGTDDRIAYDTTAKTATVNVVDDNGVLKYGAITWETSGDDATLTNTFVNSFTPFPTQASLTLKKLLSGATLEDGQFAFDLKDAEGKTLALATNDATGAITFAPIAFDKAGTYTYTVTEQKGSIEAITYDTSVKTATVKVTEVDGALLADVSWKSSSTADVTGNTFINTYKPADPSDPTDPTDPTDPQGQKDPNGSGDTDDPAAATPSGSSGTPSAATATAAKTGSNSAATSSATGLVNTADSPALMFAVAGIVCAVAVGAVAYARRRMSRR